jgi:toxin ParE1/3/4
MTHRVRFLPEAETDVDEAATWYEARRIGLGQEFRIVLGAAIERIRRNPDLYQAVHGAARRAALHRFPYTLIYTVSDTEVLIVACSHARRRQERWRRRL